MLAGNGEATRLRLVQSGVRSHNSDETSNLCSGSGGRFLASICRVTWLSQFATQEGKRRPRTQEFGLLLGLFTACCQFERYGCLITERTSKQKITSAASIRLMSALAEEPKGRNNRAAVLPRTDE